MKIYTRTGDAGLTSLIGGTRVAKSDLRIEAYGTVDELNSYIGLIACQEGAVPFCATLKEVQDRLFTIGALLATAPSYQKNKLPDLLETDVVALEKEMDKMSESLPMLKHFVLPGGNTLVSYCHLGRCICRRAERLAVALSTESGVDKLVIIYLNRLSDYLFVLARKLSMDLKVEEVVWKPRI